ncbi:homoserine kinase [Vagococcus vulneris]|uniref:Homoserine kinase n=1 Tax=Vagococcus vulneris TaxID=1977869 RepID=A0A430A1V8_9ENTE|nr:homoserine kinase [Vagococcus vulneris]RSU00444.1 homoserine kinase [Vagococcus vulneris]
MKIRVPATTANLGSGFDSFGLALSMYLEVEVCAKVENWHVEHQIAGLPSDENNLIVKSLLYTAPETPPHHLKVITDIPTARGLGSSSSAIVAGIELADKLNHLELSDSEKLELANSIEGHPDNVAPAILGGFVVSGITSEKVFAVSHQFIDADIVVIIPNYTLLTSSSRQVLPQEMSYRQAVAASSTANGLLAGFLTNNLKLVELLLEKDRWHEPFREHLVPELTHVRALKQELNLPIIGSVLSGAGPTVLVLAQQGSGQTVCRELSKHIKDCRITVLTVDMNGIMII